MSNENQKSKPISVYGRSKYFSTKYLKIGRDKGFMKSSNLKDKGMSYDEPVVQKFVRHVISNKYIYGGIGLVMMAGIISIFN